MLGVLFYVAHVVIGGFLWKGYSHLHQPISDLTSSGAPDKALMTTLTSVYGILMIVFAVCAYLYVKKFGSKLLSLGFFLLICMNIVSISYNFFPEDMISAHLTFTGVMHIVVTALIVPLTLLSIFFIGLGARKTEVFKKYALYSLLTSAFIFVTGGVTVFLMANRLEFFGLAERLNIGSLQLWNFIMSYKIFTMADEKTVINSASKK